jgi:hypothetical protein
MAEGTHAAGRRGWLPMARHAPVAGVARTPRSLTDAELARLLEFSMRYWYRGGEEGVWAGLVGSERLTLRLRWLSGESPAELLAARTAAVRARRLIKDAIGIIRNG